MSRKSKTKEGSQFLKALGKLFEIFKVFTDAVLAAGGKDEDIARIGTNASLLNELVAVVMKYTDKKVAEVKKYLLWKSVTLGTHQSALALGQSLEGDGYHVSDRARQILAKTSLASEPTTVDLVRVTVAELGFKKGATTAQIYTRASELGLGLCPAEVGPQLRLQYSDQPLDEWIRIGMEPISDSDGGPHVFGVDYDGDGHWLRTDDASPTNVWYPRDRWVFVRGKQ